MTYEELVKTIKAEIYPNGSENITGQMLQDTLVRIAQAGVSPSGDPMHQAYEAVGAVWNDSTGFWELNGLTDITNDQMREIYVYGIKTFGALGDSWCCAYRGSTARTNLCSPTASGFGGVNPLLAGTFSNCSQLEVIKITDDDNVYMDSRSMYLIFDNCPKLISVNNILIIENVTASNLTHANSFNAPMLANLKLKGLKSDINLGKAEKLSYESIAFLIDNAINTSPINITVYTGIYDKLTDEIVGADGWYALGQKAWTKQISFIEAPYL